MRIFDGTVLTDRHTGTGQVMLYREMMTVFSQIHTKYINTVCGQNVELLNVKLAVHIVTTGLQRVKSLLQTPVS